MVAPRTAPLQANFASPLGAPRTDGLPFPVALERGSGKALHAQLSGHLRAAVLSGTLPSGSVLPGTRTLALALGVTRGVVADAYATLVADGTLEATVGRGTLVPAGAAQATQPRVPRAPTWVTPFLAPPVDGPLPPGGVVFQSGVTTARMLDLRAWRQAWSAVARLAVSGQYGDPAGERDLRVALAAFVGRQRGLPVTADAVVVTAGTLHALNLIVRALLPPGSRVLFEEPGYRAARQVLQDAGHTVVPVEVDGGGVMIGPDSPPARLAFVTPSHQFPLGGRMSLPRRLALLEWATLHDALIIEDDYDGEFRYDAPPLPTLASLDAGGGRVLYLGSLSKVLMPGVRTGFLTAPPALIPALVRARTLLDFGHPLPVQHAVTWLLTGGHIDRHIRRARRWHAQVRQALTEELAPLAPHATLGGIEAGLHVCLHLHGHLNAQEVAAQLARRDVHVTALDTYAMTQECPQALVLGFGALTVEEARRGARVIVSVLDQS
ncbi:PLP-dependent aminotransferase family protein [Deinococcus sp.]|uniref:MocR-like pyridoxine biosynthesis transcription factor PdxR n=1 Tax=Deinococcus sp. TaxID=47478 RepID=UPI002869BC72|nr:PLP-dependent aminotransferase family protein [Deinococcus sp.]